MFKSVFALLALVSLALLSSAVNFVLTFFEVLGNLIGVFNTLDDTQLRASSDTMLCFPFVSIPVILLNSCLGDTQYLVSVIETAYGSIKWRYTGTIKHFPQYAADRIEPCPVLLTRLSVTARRQAE
jgi:hypothetical protein